MYEQWTRLTHTESGGLGYRHPNRPVAASIALLLSALLLIGAFYKIATAWPDEWQAVAALFVFGFVFFMTAQQWATVRETWFTRSPLQVTFVRDLLGWRRHRARQLEPNGVVACEWRRDPDESDATFSYQVTLSSSRSPEPPIFIHSYFDHDEPAEIGREIASFLNWSFEDRVASAAEAPSVTMFLRSRSGVRSIVRVGAHLSTGGIAIAACGAIIQSLIYFAGFCNIEMVYGWAALVATFLIFRVIFLIASRWIPDDSPPANA